MATPEKALSPVPNDLPEVRESRPSRVYRIPYTDKTTPRWVAHLLGLITVLSAGYASLSGPIKQIVATYNVGNEAGLDAAEAYRHYLEQPAKTAVTEDAAGKLEARLYASDGCVAIIWHGALDRRDSHPHFVRNLTNQDHTESPGKISLNKAVAAPLNSAIEFPSLSASILFLPSAEKEKKSPRPANGPPAHSALHASPPGRCPNPHPGAFKSSYGETKGCWIQVWREFQDGCKHYQWFNKCGSFWDADGNGIPRIYWTICNHPG